MALPLLANMFPIGEFCGSKETLTLQAMEMFRRKSFLYRRQMTYDLMEGNPQGTSVNGSETILKMGDIFVDQNRILTAGLTTQANTVL